MFPPKVVLLLVILSAPLTWGQRNKKPPPQNPIDKIQSVTNFDINKFAGKWYLLSVASECNYLKTNNHRVEATLIKASASKTYQGVEVLSISTFRELDGICWEIKHAYETKKIKGRFILKAKGYLGQVDVVLAETDYQNYAILYYQRRNKITLKLYGRKTTATNDIYRKFDDHATKQGIELEYIYPFPAYGFCETADRFHILNGNIL
ncbi:PREDICTED: complement component C8 gamma chain [Nanorana parkeri]|uniref:complement component C8 gamma chain n=1 Tax=Nanorana parkeri TaxID=125878 RepID=UPI0008543D3F|nr:PREDICTED: complement component C8 gamma chain [Nanorana parkeri]